MTTFKRLAWVSLAQVLGSELNSLGSTSYSAFGATGYDNTSGLYLYFALDIVLASLTPTTGAYLQPFMGQSLDGTTYDDPPSSTNPGYHMALPPVAVTTGAAAKRIISPMFEAPASKVKFALLNGAGVALASSANTVTLYGGYDQGV